jgi:hypothetical protein
MICVQDRGTTLSGRNYLPEYLERIPNIRHDTTVTNLLRSKLFLYKIVDVEVDYYAYKLEKLLGSIVLHLCVL